MGLPSQNPSPEHNWQQTEPAGTEAQDVEVLWVEKAKWLVGSHACAHVTRKQAPYTSLGGRKERPWRENTHGAWQAEPALTTFQAQWQPLS